MDSRLWHTSLSPQTYLVRSLRLCNNRRPIPKRSTAAAVFAVGDDSGIVRVFYTHALHLPGDGLQIFGCKQTRGEQTCTWATRPPAHCAPPGRLARERDGGWSAVCSLSTRGIPPEELFSLALVSRFVPATLFILRNGKHPEKHEV